MHKGTALQALTRLLPTKALCHPRRVSLTVLANTHWMPKMKNTNPQREFGLQGKELVSTLGGPFCCFEFEDEEDIVSVLVRGSRRFKNNFLKLERWSPEIGCVREEGMEGEEWVRIVGLPLHLWCRELFKKLGTSADVSSQWTGIQWSDATSNGQGCL